jgi:predicted dehydrogenase
MKEGRMGIALIGLGGYATRQLAPAFLETQHCYLAGIVTGDAAKAAEWKARHHLAEKNIYHYNNFDSIKHNADIDIVYIELPNTLHAEYVIRAAQAGKHVICEKPLGVTVEECGRMIAACREAGVLLSVGYRLHFDPYHIEIMRLCREEVYGPLKKITTAFSYLADASRWRFNKQLAGGGALVDIGIYCIQAVCCCTGQVPVAVTAQAVPAGNSEAGDAVEAAITFQLEMPGSLVAECKSSYLETENVLRIATEKGIIELQPAFAYSGLSGHTPEGKIEFPAGSQQAKQMDAFALAIQNKQPSIVPGEMGKRDVQIMQAIYGAVKSGERVVVEY